MNSSNISDETDYLSLNQIIKSLKYFTSLLLKQKLKIGLISVLGGIIGLFYAYVRPVYFTAKLTFIVEESKSSYGGLAALAGQFGIDFGGAGGNSSLLNGENLLIFLKSSTLNRNVLLTSFDSINNISLADRYAEVYGFKKRWESEKKIGKINFTLTPKKTGLSRVEDSLLMFLCDKIVKNDLVIERPEKKATFVNVEVKTKDELLSKYYCERLVFKAIEKYIQIKTKRQKTNLEKLQFRADSIAKILSYKTFANAIEQEKIIDLNPAEKKSMVASEISNRDKTMLYTIYGEVIKNLEIAKMQLSQETPTIQIVDEVFMPLKKTKSSKIFLSLSFFLVFGLLYCTYFFISLFLKKISAS